MALVQWQLSALSSAPALMEMTTIVCQAIALWVLRRSRILGEVLCPKLEQGIGVHGVCAGNAQCQKFWVARLGARRQGG